MVILIMPIVHEHRVGGIFTISNLVIDHLPLFVVLATRLHALSVLSRRNDPRRLFVGNIGQHFRVGFDSEFFVLLYLSSQVGRSVGVAGIFMVKAIQIMIVHCHEISHRMLVGAIVLLRIERGNIIKSKLLLYVILNDLVAFLEVVHLKRVTAVLYDIVRIENVLLLLIDIFAQTTLLIQNVGITRLLYLPIRWLILGVKALGTIRVVKVGRLVHLVGVDLIDNEGTQNAFCFGLLHILRIFHKQKRLLGNGLHCLRSHAYTIK